MPFGPDGPGTPAYEEAAAKEEGKREIIESIFGFDLKDRLDELETTVRQQGFIIEDLQEQVERLENSVYISYTPEEALDGDL